MLFLVVTLLVSSGIHQLEDLTIKKIGGVAAYHNKVALSYWGNGSEVSVYDFQTKALKVVDINKARYFMPYLIATENSFVLINASVSSGPKPIFISHEGEYLRREDLTDYENFPEGLRMKAVVNAAHNKGNFIFIDDQSYHVYTVDFIEKKFSALFSEQREPGLNKAWVGEGDQFYSVVNETGEIKKITLNGANKSEQVIRGAIEPLKAKKKYMGLVTYKSIYSFPYVVDTDGAIHMTTFFHFDPNGNLLKYPLLKAASLRGLNLENQNDLSLASFQEQQLIYLPDDFSVELRTHSIVTSRTETAGASIAGSK